MKILVLMPLDERSVYMANGIYSGLSPYAKDRTLVMPMFMQYTITTKLSEGWEYAVFSALVAAKNVYEAAQKAKDDLIIIGNCDASLEFDIVFNFQDIEKDEDYQDKFLNKLTEIIETKSDDEDKAKLLAWLNLHKAEESKMPLHNVNATADFLSAYLETDPHIEEIHAKYKEQVEAIYGKTYQA